MAKIKAGVIGAGIGKYHLDGYAQHPNAEAVALCDLNEELLAEVQARGLRAPSESAAILREDRDGRRRR